MFYKLLIVGSVSTSMFSFFYLRQLLLSNEILNYNDFDDKVMVNRQRINKGSKNFKNIISNSDNINQIYEYLNNIETFKKLYSLFDLKKSQWIVTENLNNFSKKYFGKQSDSYYEKIIKFLAEKKILKTKINLDIDFSVSGKGYYRGPHRDRETRILNFLLYLSIRCTAFFTSFILEDPVANSTGLFFFAIIRLVIEYLFINTIADEINKSLLATIGLLFIIVVAFLFISI